MHDRQFFHQQEIDNNLLFRQRVTEFFGAYINEADELSFPDGTPFGGTIPMVIIQDIIKLLFDKCVFVSIRDMQKTALRACSVILPYELFETYLDEVNNT